MHWSPLCKFSANSDWSFNTLHHAHSWFWCLWQGKLLSLFFSFYLEVLVHEHCLLFQYIYRYIPSLFNINSFLIWSMKFNIHPYKLSVPSPLTTVATHVVVVWITTEVCLSDIKTNSMTVNIVARLKLCSSTRWCWTWLVITVLVVKWFVFGAAVSGCLAFMIETHHWSCLASTTARPWAL